MKFSVNNKCPCGSNIKYKKCCQVFHKGKIASTSLELMKSRYSAYVLSDAKYIMKTTHEDNTDYSKDFSNWSVDILEFCNQGEFKSLKILDLIDGDKISFVKFHVELFIHGEDKSFTEKSKFLKHNNQWCYHSAQFGE